MAMLCEDKYPALGMNKVINMCFIHDFGEAITGDIPAFLKTSQNIADKSETFSMLYLAEIKELELTLKNEIELIEFFDDLPENLTYPLIQPFLFQKASHYKQNITFI